MKDFLVLAALRDVQATGPQAVRNCRRSVTKKLRGLPAPKDMMAAEKMAARAVLAPCRACGMCEMAL